jgi:paired small multidrug resistance pump
MTHSLAMVAGLAGATMILLAYALQQAGRIEARGAAFPALNAVGALGVLISLCVEFNLAAFLLESAWLLVSLAGLRRWMRSRG